MSFQNNILSFEDSAIVRQRQLLRDEYRSVVNACRRTISQQLPRLLAAMFEKLDDTLYKLADKADSNQRQTDFFDAMREVRKHRERISSGFEGLVLEGYDDFWSSVRSRSTADKDRDPQDSEEFSLLEKEDLEEGLAINNMIARGESQFYRALYGLNQRFGFLIGRQDLDIKDNPLSPAAICTRFHEMTKAIPLDVQVKLVIYKQFQHEVLDSLGRFYDELNTLLIEGGIYAKLPGRIKRTASSGQASPVDDPGEAVVEVGYEEEDPRIQEEFVSTLRQLLSRRRTQREVAATHGLPSLGTADVVGALSLIQQNGFGPDGSSYDDRCLLDIRSHLLQVVGQQGLADRRIGGNDEDAIDVIAMLFEFILEDRSLPDAMKALLSRLQIPMLKAAILDKAFFYRKNHPARRLLNSMAKAAIGWSGDAGKGDGGLYEKMTSIVERVLTGFDKDIELFSQLDEEFNAYIEREDQGSKVAEQRVTQITEGKEQLKAARHLVFEEINNRMFGKEGIPLPVITLVKEGWRDVMLLICLRKGTEGQEWQDALGLLDKLLWSVAPNPDRAKRQSLLTEMPLLLKGLRAGLTEISFDQHKMAKLFKDLHLCHLSCLKGEDPTRVVGGATAGGRSKAREGLASGEAGNGAGESNGSQESVPRDEHSRLAEEVAIGTWLEIREANGMTFRAKLSWRSTVSETCLFVNRKGMKVVEISLSEFAAWLRSGKAAMLQEVDTPLMDRALTAMVDVLKKTGKNGANKGELLADPAGSAPDS